MVLQRSSVRIQAVFSHLLHFIFLVTVGQCILKGVKFVYYFKHLVGTEDIFVKFAKDTCKVMSMQKGEFDENCYRTF